MTKSKIFDVLGQFNQCFSILRHSSFLDIWPNFKKKELDVNNKELATLLNDIYFAYITIKKCYDVRKTKLVPPTEKYINIVKLAKHIFK